MTEQVRDPEKPKLQMGIVEWNRRRDCVRVVDETVGGRLFLYLLIMVAWASRLIFAMPWATSRMTSPKY